MSNSNIAYYTTATDKQRELLDKRINESLSEQSMLVDELLNKEFFCFDDIVNYGCKDEDGEEREIMQWYFINDNWTREKLIGLGEPVLDSDFGAWWGRTCHGQAIIQDPTFWNIYKFLVDGDEIEMEVSK